MAFFSAGFALWRFNTISSSSVRYRDTSGGPDSDMEAMKEILKAQQQLLQKIYFELDEEREASSIAATEAMSMILRLQAEKARVKMEANQYKREAEEKMCLAEESLAIFEDIMYQKESELEFLEHQVEAYKAKLVEMGCTDLTIPEFEPQEQPVLPQRNEQVATEIILARNVTNPVPVAQKDLLPKKKSSGIPLPKRAGTGSKGEDMQVYWERIKKLEEQVKAISKVPRRANKPASPKNRFRSCSVPPPELDEDSSLSASPLVETTAAPADSTM